MNYNADRPIESGEQDLLGRLYFANQFGKAIYEYNGSDGLVIGLFGKWGTGKTSVINMTLNEINRLSEKDENKPMIMRFAPWNYSDKNNLISLFFQSLKNQVDIQDNSEFKNKVGKALIDYSGALDALSVIPAIGSGIATVLKTLAQAKGANLSQSPNLDKTRKILEDALIKVDKKIIIIIDDIDRLTNSQIRDIFQLVKQVADFPNVIYLLSMDREVVCRALTEIQNVDGRDYLEKIIQVPFELPELKKSKLHNIFFKKLNQVVNDLPNEIIWDEDYWSNVFKNCVEPYINTIRDVNRVINTFQFRYGMLYNETSFEDMVGITTLEVLEPKLYKWICNNKDVVCGGMSEFLSNGINKINYEKLYHEEFKNLGINPVLAINCISTMFPAFAREVDKYGYINQSNLDIRARMRIACEGRFELYFIFDLDDIKVSRNIINKCIYKLGKDDLKMVIEEINRQGNIVYLLEEIKSLVEDIPYNRLELIASVLLYLQSGFKSEKSNGMFAMSSSYIAESLINNIIKRFETDEEKYKIISSLLENVNKNSLCTIATIINRIELAYGRLKADSENKQNQIVSLEHLEKLEKIYVKKVNEIVNSESISNISRFANILYLWKCFDKDSVKKYMENLFKNEINKLKFICAMAGMWNSTNSNGWSFSSKIYSEYISKDEVYNIIQDFDKSRLNEFNEIEQIKLASFVLNYPYDDMDMDMDYVNEQDALKLVNEWKMEKEILNN